MQARGCRFEPGRLHQRVVEAGYVGRRMLEPVGKRMHRGSFHASADALSIVRSLQRTVAGRLALSSRGLAPLAGVGLMLFDNWIVWVVISSNHKT